jgi:anaerobic magnesium-protoporphyrin IX monomethyl ester cyclase
MSAAQGSPTAGRRPRVLLVSMPDRVSGLDAVIRIPSLGIGSLAGSLPGAEVRLLDLALARGRIGPLVRSVADRFAPDLVGISAMSFQYDSARRAARLVREVLPGARTVLGGYHATLMAAEIGAGDDRGLFDFIVRGEGERTLAALVARIAGGGDGYEAIPGLSFRSGAGFVHNPAANLAKLEDLPLPDRSRRVIDGGRFFGLRFDSLETSRGCTLGCTFCSIRKMYGRAVRFFPLERVRDDLRSLERRGTRGAFFVDDNITLDPARLGELCRMIAAEGLDRMAFVMQASVAGLAADARLPRMLARANVRWVFLGIESGSARSLAAMRKRVDRDAAREVVARLRRAGVCVIGGFIVGNPDDDRSDIRGTYRYARELGVDHAIVQCLTPYPATDVRDLLLAEGLVTNPDDFSRYNGLMVNVRTRHLSARSLARWMVLEGLPLYFDPVFVLRNRLWWSDPGDAPAMLGNNLRFVAEGLRGRLFQSRHRW